jgi:hypothetical protein
VNDRDGRGTSELEIFSEARSWCPMAGDLVVVSATWLWPENGSPGWNLQSNQPNRSLSDTWVAQIAVMTMCTPYSGRVKKTGREIWPHVG